MKSTNRRTYETYKVLVERCKIEIEISPKHTCECSESKQAFTMDAIAAGCRIGY